MLSKLVYSNVSETGVWGQSPQGAVPPGAEPPVAEPPEPQWQSPRSQVEPPGAEQSQGAEPPVADGYGGLGAKFPAAGRFL